MCHRRSVPEVRGLSHAATTRIGCIIAKDEATCKLAGRIALDSESRVTSIAVGGRWL
jgi:hypothetical protein